MPIESGDAARAFAETINAQVKAGFIYPEPPHTMWWSLSRPDGGGIHVKVSEDDDGYWVITDVYIHGHGLGATDLQSVPLTQLDLIMNLVGHFGPEIVAEAYNVTGQQITVDPSGEPSLAVLRRLAAHAPTALPVITSESRPRLTRPDGTDPDGFSARVAAAYREYAPQTRAPALKIAEEAGVPVATARSWIREARRRGKLPQGRRGRAG